MYGSASKAYDLGSKATASTRELEANALFKAARQLEACKEAWDAPEREAALAEALKYNQRLWTFFQSELERGDNPLPADVKAGLLRLSALVDQRTFQVMAKPDREQVQLLIHINRQVAAGLSVRPQESAVEDATQGA